MFLYFIKIVLLHTKKCTGNFHQKLDKTSLRELWAVNLIYYFLKIACFSFLPIIDVYTLSVYSSRVVLHIFRVFNFSRKAKKIDPFFAKNAKNCEKCCFTPYARKLPLILYWNDPILSDDWNSKADLSDPIIT